MLRRSSRPQSDGPRASDHLLVVHHDARGCELLVRFLTASGFHVERAHELLEMTAALASAPFGCIVLDVDGGGIGANPQLLDVVRNAADRDVAATPAVLVGAGGSSELPAWQAGADEVLTRPFHIDDLVAAVHRAIGRSDEERLPYRRRQLDAARTA